MTTATGGLVHTMPASVRLYINIFRVKQMVLGRKREGYMLLSEIKTCTSCQVEWTLQRERERTKSFFEIISAGALLYIVYSMLIERDAITSARLVAKWHVFLELMWYTFKSFCIRFFSNIIDKRKTKAKNHHHQKQQQEIREKDGFLRLFCDR